MPSSISKLAFAAAIIAASTGLAHASCGDRPGTPNNVSATPLSSSSIKFSWHDTTRPGEIPLGPFYDISVTDNFGHPTGLDSTGEGYLFGGKVYKNLAFNRTYCFKVRARTEAGTQGCVSQIWSATVCATTFYPPLGGSTPVNLPYGPDTCKQGFVWREASRNDHVCVYPSSRSIVAQENQMASSRRSPHGGPYGPATCLNGYVWREAFPGDTVCVIPQRRTDVAHENTQARNRKVQP
jgi:hypothetical protein